MPVAYGSDTARRVPAANERGYLAPGQTAEKPQAENQAGLVVLDCIDVGGNLPLCLSGLLL